VQLDWMQLNDLQNFGIRGNNVTGFSFDNSVISGTNGTAAGAFDEAAISFNNLLGSASISDSSIGNGFEYILKVLNSSGTLNRLTIDNTDFGTNNTALGGDAVQIVASNTATVNVTVTDSGFTNAREDLFNAVATQSADMDVVFRDNTLSNNHTNKVSAASNILVFSTSNGDVTYDISHNTLTSGATGSSIAVAKGVPDTGSGGTMTGTVNANTIGVSGVVGSGSEFTGIFASALGSGTHTTAITNNTIYHYNEEGIFLKANDPLTGGNSVLNATVTGNITTEPDSLAFAGLWVVAGSGSGTETNTVNVVLGNVSNAALQNDFTNGDPANGSDVFLQESGSGSVINLSRAGSAAGTAAGVTQDDNVGTPTVVAVGTVNLVNTLPPTPPPVAPLLAATGGVEAAPPADNTPPADTTPPQENAGGPGTGDQPPSTPPVVPATTIVNDGVLSQAELDYFVDAAIARWSATGLTTAQIDALEAMTFGVADLSGLNLGAFTPAQITLDADAAGHGWYLDGTPRDDAEFGHAQSATRLTTDPTQAPAGHYDLLTTVMHEMGHALGLQDRYEGTARDALMYGWLFTGERRLPGAGEADGAVAGSITTEEFAGSPIAVGPLHPAGRQAGRHPVAGDGRPADQPADRQPGEHRHGHGDQHAAGVPRPEHQYRHYHARHAGSRRHHLERQRRRRRHRRQRHQGRDRAGRQRGHAVAVRRRQRRQRAGQPRLAARDRGPDQRKRRLLIHRTCAGQLHRARRPGQFRRRRQHLIGRDADLVGDLAGAAGPRRWRSRRRQRRQRLARARPGGVQQRDHARLQYRADHRHRQRHQQYARLRLLQTRRQTCL
jgi:hypothetical protein